MSAQPHNEPLHLPVSLRELAERLNRPFATLRAWALLSGIPLVGVLTSDAVARLTRRSAESRRKVTATGFYSQGTDAGNSHFLVDGEVVLSDQANRFARLMRMTDKAFIDHCITTTIASFRAALGG